MTALVVFVLVLSAVLVLELAKKKPETTTQPTEPPPAPTETLSRLHSRWATDSGVLKLEEDLKNLSEELKNVDLKESQLSPPVLDMDVEF